MDSIRFVLSTLGIKVCFVALGAILMYANLKSEGRILPKNKCNDINEEENII